MKKNNVIIALLIINSAFTLINAYENSFFNNTDIPIAIAIQYTGSDNIKEPLYKQLVKPASMVTFSPGKINIPAIKWGFCLDNIYYAENPTIEQKKHNFEKTFWKKIQITWVEEKSLTKKLEGKASKRHRPLRRERPIPSVEKSLCRDRHFDIIRDEQDKIIITSSLHE